MSAVSKLAVIAALLLAGGAASYFGNEYRLAAQQRRDAVAVTGGNPARSRIEALSIKYGCGGCHTIPGIAGATGRVGPNLGNEASQIYVGGVITNSAENLTRWIVSPQVIDPMSAMPTTGISEDEARDITAYLYSLPQ
ncbi:MAG TPA: c-type cytochrome [Arsenicitalea sp.]|nr:c-type cytochrome [Arsenicitalea sp.]